MVSDEPATFGYLDSSDIGLFTDRYELTMLRGYLEQRHTPEATFSLFYRSLPRDRGYVIAAGLEQAIAYIQDISFGAEQLTYLQEQGFPDPFLEFLADFTFTGDIRAIPEGTPVFPNEPLIEVTAPIQQAQLFETMLLNQLGYQSLIATKAARMRDTVRRYGDDQQLIDFGARRAHGTDAGIKAARAAYIGGFDGTSNEAAGAMFGIPAVGTMAHSWVQSFPTERASFEAFAEIFGEDSIFLIDTYDTVGGARTAVEVATEIGLTGGGVRLDSGDLVALSKDVRSVLPSWMDIFVSSGVDEYFLRRFFEEGGVADGFGPGTALSVSSDVPTLNPVYKLVAVEERGAMQPSMKLSEGKVTYPGAKSVRRFGDSTDTKDVIACPNEDIGGRELLVDIVNDGELIYDLPSLDEIRRSTQEGIQRLPTEVRRLRNPTDYSVDVSEKLARTTEQVQAGLSARMASR